MGIVGKLTPEQLNLFNSQGYLVIENFSTKEELDGMTNRMKELLDGFDPSTASIFSSKNQKELTDRHFYESAESISFFFEEKAFGDDGCLNQPKELSINKVGHALHEIDPVFKKFSNSEQLLQLLLSLGYKRPVVIQSMYLFKQPGIGGEVVPHQDNSFLYTEPPSCTGFWLALEDATITNGCLWVIPGSHKNGLVRRFIRDDDVVHFDRPSPSYDHNDFVPLKVKAALRISHQNRDMLIACMLWKQMAVYGPRTIGSEGKWPQNLYMHPHPDSKLFCIRFEGTILKDLNGITVPWIIQEVLLLTNVMCCNQCPHDVTGSILCMEQDSTIYWNNTADMKCWLLTKICSLVSR